MNDADTEQKSRAPDDSNDHKAGDYLMVEYGVISEQIIHWDTFHWTKARFFLALEGIALFATINKLIPYLTKPNNTFGVNIFLLLLGMVVLNWLLCHVWLLTSLRNREFLKIRFKRGKQIEQHSSLKGIVSLYHFETEELDKPNVPGWGSYYWEINIPIIFVLAWSGLLIAGILLLTKEERQLGICGSLIAFVLLFVFVRLHDWWASKHMGTEL